MHKDKNGDVVKVGDTLKDGKGIVGHIENIAGCCFLVFRGLNAAINKTIIFTKVDLSKWELKK